MSALAAEATVKHDPAAEHAAQRAMQADPAYRTLVRQFSEKLVPKSPDDSEDYEAFITRQQYAKNLAVLEAQDKYLRDAEERAAEAEAAKNAPHSDAVIDALFASGGMSVSKFVNRGSGSLRAAELAAPVALLLDGALAYAPDLDSAKLRYGWLTGENLQRPRDVSLLISRALFPALEALQDLVASAEPEGRVTSDHLEIADARLACSSWIANQSWNGYRSLFGALKMEPSVEVGLDAREGAASRWLLTLPAEPLDRPVVWAEYGRADFPGGLRGSRGAVVNEFDELLARCAGGELKRSTNSPRVPLDDSDFRNALEVIAHVIR